MTALVYSEHPYYDRKEISIEDLKQQKLISLNEKYFISIIYSCLKNINRPNYYRKEITIFVEKKKKGMIDQTEILIEPLNVNDIDTVTLYLNAGRQLAYYDYILSLKPKRIIFNPGTENDELEQLAAENNIEALEACTLVLLSTGQY